MSIVSICVIAIISAILSITIRRYNQELSILVSIGASVIILLSVIEYLLTGIDTVVMMLEHANINAQYIIILLKVIGICFVTEFACDCTKEAGYDSLTSNIALAGRIVVLVTAMPMFKSVLTLVTSLSSGEMNV